MKSLLLALLLLPGAALAADWIVVSVASYHLERSNGYREFNPGVGFELEISERWSLLGGGYSNSHGDFSAYAGAAYMPWRWHRLRFGSVMGVVSGYDAKVLPVLLPAVAFEGETFGVNVVMAPKHGSSPGGFGFQAKWRF